MVDMFFVLLMYWIGFVVELMICLLDVFNFGIDFIVFFFVLFFVVFWVIVVI